MARRIKNTIKWNGDYGHRNPTTPCNRGVQWPDGRWQNDAGEFKSENVILALKAMTATEYAQELNSSRRESNPDNPFSLVEDRSHWSGYGVETGWDLARYLNWSTWWEMYRDAYGVKPRGLLPAWNEADPDEVQRRIDELEGLYREPEPEPPLGALAHAMTEALRGHR